MRPYDLSIGLWSNAPQEHSTCGPASESSLRGAQGLDSGNQILDDERLGDVVVPRLAEEVAEHRRLVARHEEDRDPWPLFLNLGSRDRTRHLRHDAIDEHQRDG